MDELVIIRIMVSAIMLSIFGVWYCVWELVNILRRICQLLDDKAMLIKLYELLDMIEPRESEEDE